MTPFAQQYYLFFFFLALIPTNCVGVIELEIELLTGRTHQIRGQLSTEGFPLVGDESYGGASNTKNNKYKSAYMTSAVLALQCCELSFMLPEKKQQQQKEEQGANDEIDTPSSSDWITHRLEDAWWTPFLNEYDNKK